jgi:hypothetical protein
VKNAHGAGNIVTVRRGEDLRASLETRISAMRADFERVEFYWDKTVNDPEYHASREYPGDSAIVKKWDLLENVRDLVEFRKKVKWLEVLREHFQPGRDYELTVNEVVEILS